MYNFTAAFASALVAIALMSSSVQAQEIDLQLQEPMQPSTGKIVGATIGGSFVGLLVTAGLSVGVAFATPRAADGVTNALVVGGLTAPALGSLGGWMGARLVGAEARYDHTLAGGLVGTALGAGLFGLALLSDNDSFIVTATITAPLLALSGAVIGTVMSHRSRVSRVQLTPITRFDRNGGTLGVNGTF